MSNSQCEMNDREVGFVASFSTMRNFSHLFLDLVNFQFRKIALQCGKFFYFGQF